MDRKNELTRRQALGLMGVTAASGWAVLTGSASAATCAARLLGAGSTETSIDLGTNGDANNINPILAVDSDGYWRSDLIFTPMVLLDPVTLNPTPSLARSWTVSPSGSTYTFHLDPRAKFQDGVPVTAADVEFTVLSMLNPHYTGPFQTYWSRLAGAEAVISGSAKTLPGLQVLDPHTIKMTLSQPYAGFLTVIVRQLKPLPAHLLSGKGVLTTSSPFSLHPVGSGQYQFDDWRVNSQFQVKAWSQYWATPARMKSVTQTIIPDQTTITDGLESGQLDASIVPPPSSLPQLRQDSSLRVYSVAPEYPEALWFNMRKEPWKSNLKLRQAIAYAVDFMDFQRTFMYLPNPRPSSFYSYASWAYNARGGISAEQQPDAGQEAAGGGGFSRRQGLGVHHHHQRRKHLPGSGTDISSSPAVQTGSKGKHHCPRVVGVHLLGPVRKVRHGGRQYRERNT